MQSPYAGRPAPASILVDVTRLISAYHTTVPDLSDATQRVAFGTSGHRGSSLKGAFNETHIRAITQAICDHRKQAGVDGPLFLGRDTHALSIPATLTALEVLVGNGVEVIVDEHDRPLPTPVISHAVITHNRGRKTGLADAIVVTPSHNPPEDGGFKYNPPHGGPADSTATKAIESAANAMIADGNKGVQRGDPKRAIRRDMVLPYVDDLGAVIDFDVIRRAKLRLGADPLGGAAVPFWHVIGERHALDLTVVSDVVDPQFAFMRVDNDGKIRMDCSSPAAMAGLVEMKDRFDVAFGNDTDADRHGIVVPSVGLLNPNHYLALAISHLFTHRPGWRADAGIGKTLVSSSLIDRVAGKLGRRLVEVPVGFKWFVPGLVDGSLGFGGEESAGASFLRKDGTTWTTDKDGPLLCLLAAEIRATSGRDLGDMYKALTAELGDPSYKRVDAPATPAQKARLGKLTPDAVEGTELAGQPIVDRLTRAPGNGEALGGLKVATKDGWFAARPSGTEDVYKIYAESFLGPDHLERIIAEAQAMVGRALET